MVPLAPPYRETLQRAGVCCPALLLFLSSSNQFSTTFTCVGADSITLLKKDHDTVKSLFDEFEKAETPAAKRKAVDQALIELKIQDVLEEEMFYNSVRE